MLGCKEISYIYVTSVVTRDFCFYGLQNAEGLGNAMEQLLLGLLGVRIVAP
jgi:hypothetical protein